MWRRKEYSQTTPSQHKIEDNGNVEKSYNHNQEENVPCDNLHMFNSSNSNKNKLKKNNNKNENKKKTANSIRNNGVDEYIKDFVNENVYDNEDFIYDENKNYKQKSKKVKNDETRSIKSHYTNGDNQANPEYNQFQNYHYKEQSYYDENKTEANLLGKFDSKGSNGTNNISEQDFIAKFNSKGSMNSNNVHHQDEVLAKFNSKGSNKNYNKNNNNNLYNNSKLNYKNQINNKNSSNQKDDYLGQFNSKGSIHSHNYYKNNHHDDFLAQFNSKGSLASNSYLNSQQDDYLSRFNSKASSISNNNKNYCENNENPNNNPKKRKNLKNNDNNNPSTNENKPVKPHVNLNIYYEKFEKEKYENGTLDLENRGNNEYNFKKNKANNSNNTQTGEKKELTLKDILAASGPSNSRKIVIVDNKTKEKSNINKDKQTTENESNSNINISNFNSAPRIVTIQKKNSNSIMILQNSQFTEIPNNQENINSQIFKNNNFQETADRVENKREPNIQKDMNNQANILLNPSNQAKKADKDNKKNNKKKFFSINNYDYNTNSIVNEKINEAKNSNNVNDTPISLNPDEDFPENEGKTSKNGGKLFNSNFEDTNEVDENNKEKEKDIMNNPFEFEKKFASNQHNRNNICLNLNPQINNKNVNALSSKKNNYNYSSCNNQNKNNEDDVITNNNKRASENKNLTDEIFDKIINNNNADKLSIKSEKTSKTTKTLNSNKGNSSSQTNKNKPPTGQKTNPEKSKNFIDESLRNELKTKGLKLIQSEFNEFYNTHSIPIQLNNYMNNEEKTKNNNLINSNQYITREMIKSHDNYKFDCNDNENQISSILNQKHLKIDLNKISCAEEILNENIRSSANNKDFYNRNEIDNLIANLTPNKKNIISNRLYSQNDNNQLSNNVAVNLHNRFLDRNENIFISSQTTQNIPNYFDKSDPQSRSQQFDSYFSENNYQYKERDNINPYDFIGNEREANDCIPNLSQFNTISNSKNNTLNFNFNHFKNIEKN